MNQQHDSLHFSFENIDNERTTTSPEIDLSCSLEHFSIYLSSPPRGSWDPFDSFSFSVCFLSSLLTTLSLGFRAKDAGSEVDLNSISELMLSLLSFDEDSFHSKSNHISLQTKFQDEKLTKLQDALEMATANWKTHFSHFHYISSYKCLLCVELDLRRWVHPFPTADMTHCMLCNVKIDLCLESQTKFTSLWDGNNCNCKCHTQYELLTLFLYSYAFHQLVVVSWRRDSFTLSAISRAMSCLCCWHCWTMIKQFLPLFLPFFSLASITQIKSLFFPLLWPPCRDRAWVVVQHGNGTWKKTVERFFSFLICSTQSSPFQHSNFFLIDFMGRWSLGYLCCISQIEKSFKGEIAWSMGIFGERISVIDEVELDS